MARRIAQSQSKQGTFALLPSSFVRLRADCSVFFMAKITMTTEIFWECASPETGPNLSCTFKIGRSIPSWAVVAFHCEDERSIPPSLALVHLMDRLSYNKIPHFSDAVSPSS